MKDSVALANAIREAITREGVFICDGRGIPLDTVSEAHFIQSLAHAVEEHIAIAMWDEDVTSEVEVDVELLNACKEAA